MDSPRNAAILRRLTLGTNCQFLQAGISQERCPNRGTCLVPIQAAVCSRWSCLASDRSDRFFVIHIIRICILQMASAARLRMNRKV